MRTEICPQCGTPTVQDRYTGDYCEECGWPDENRNEDKSVKRVFEIEWPEENGPMWMNVSNLLICLTNTCRNTRFTVRDLTDISEGVIGHIESAGPMEYTPLDEVINQAIGEASMCWHTTPSGLFDSDAAKRVSENLLLRVRAIQYGDAKEDGKVPSANP